MLTRAVDALAHTASNAWETKIIQSADGTRLVYRLGGKGDPLVMLHGGGSNAKEYFGVADLLKDRYAIALLERRNYGISGSTGSPHTFEQEAADVAVVLQSFDRPGYLFGHSAGAWSRCMLRATIDALYVNSRYTSRRSAAGVPQSNRSLPRCASSTTPVTSSACSWLQ